MEIQRALEAASVVVLVVSKASARSKWVRAEIHRALELQKDVIPVVIEETDIPLRWSQLQHLDWTDPQRSAFGLLVDLLPKRAAVVLKRLLEIPHLDEAIRDLIERNPEWLPIDRPCNPEYAYFYRVGMRSGGILDVFAGRFDTGGPRGYLYYLGSPYSSPFMKKGKPSRELAKTLRLAAMHFHELQEQLPHDHLLNPANGLNKRGMRFFATLEDRYRSLNVRMVFGRRSHYENREHRENLITKWCQENGVDWRGSFEFISYDRLLNSSREWSSRFGDQV